MVEGWWWMGGVGGEGVCSGRGKVVERCDGEVR